MSKIFTVSNIISQIRKSLESEFSNLVIEGEISNLSASSSGHYYLSLKDDQSMISCALFKGMAMRNPIIRQIKDGTKVQIWGDISVYDKRGTFQVIIKKIVPVGAGDLKQKFENLKMKLAQKGLFELERKKSITAFPQKVGVVTALGAAALQDFLNIITRRSHGFEIIISPSLVQGDMAAQSMIKALEKLKKIDDIDVVVLTRGGGSLEDLWAFNDEDLIFYLSQYPIPIISAVGHQVDFTLTDYVADLRVETPSAAAEYLSSPQVKILSTLSAAKNQLIYFTEKKMNQEAMRVSSRKPLHLINKLSNKVSRYEQLIEHQVFRLKQQGPKKIERSYMELDFSIEKIKTSVNKLISQAESKIAKPYEFLRAADPQKVLQRGYSYLEHEGSVISGVDKLNKIKQSEKIKVVFHDGSGELTK